MLKIKKRGKILRIKPGYNPNCSGGMYIFLILIIGGPALIFTAISAIIAKRLYDKHISESETYEKGAI